MEIDKLQETIIEKLVYNNIITKKYDIDKILIIKEKINISWNEIRKVCSEFKILLIQEGVNNDISISESVNLIKYGDPVFGNKYNNKKIDAFLLLKMFQHANEQLKHFLISYDSAVNWLHICEMVVCLKYLQEDKLTVEYHTHIQ